MRCFDVWSRVVCRFFSLLISLKCLPLTETAHTLIAAFSYLADVTHSDWCDVTLFIPLPPCTGSPLIPNPIYKRSKSQVGTRRLREMYLAMQIKYLFNCD